MDDIMKTGFEGYFKVECIKDGKVIDIFEDHNTIMRSARRSMAEIFLNRKNIDKNIQFANRFVIGTEGCTFSEYTPKSEQTGFNKDKLHQCLYSEQPVVTATEGSDADLHKWDIVKYYNKYYRYCEEDAVVTITDSLINSEKFIPTVKPSSLCIKIVLFFLANEFKSSILLVLLRLNIGTLCLVLVRKGRI